MADDEQTLSDIEFGADTKQVIRLFANDRAAALALLRQTLPERKPVGAVLRDLNKLGRHDIVLALGDATVFDAKTPELVIIEQARALVQSGVPSGAVQFLAEMARSRGRDYLFQYSAGRLLADMRLFRQALGFFETAFALKPTLQAAERIFLCHMTLEQYGEAAQAMGRLVRTGNYRAFLGKDFAFLLEHIAPGDLDPDLAFALAALPGADDAVAFALLPHLVAADMLDSVLAAVDREIAKFGVWDEAALLSVVPYLARRGQIDHLLRIHAQYGALSPAVSACFVRVLGDMPAAQMAKFLSPAMTGFAERGGAQAAAYFAAADRFAASASADDALEMIRLLSQTVAGEDAGRFYAREKNRLDRLAALAAEKSGQDDAMEVLAQFIVFCIEPATRGFFASPAAAELTEAVAAARRLDAAPEDSRLAYLREGYFRFYLERRRDLIVDTLTNDFQFGEAVLEYFARLAEQRPVATIPAGADLSARLGQTAMSLETGKSLDRLTSFALLQGRPNLDLARPDAYDEFCWWYLTALAGACKIAPSCLQPDIVAYLNETVSGGDAFGLGVTRFLRLVRSKSNAYRQTFDLGNVIDRTLFIIELIASVLPQNTQYLPLFLPFLETDGARPALLDRIFDALAGAAEPGHVRFSDAAAGTLPPRIRVRDGDAPQDVLLIGHAAKDSGLARNFSMLAGALATEGVAFTGLDFDAKAITVGEDLRRWSAACRPHPIVVFAVNAHDVPDFFAKDGDGILADCYTVGFFLWEVSRIPPVQELGVALVDEIWAPTAYVADIYAPYARTHVVGKGLFRGDEPALTHIKTAARNGAFTFVTVFDFDSSIERKNPLAVVQAFRAAFRPEENVRLIVKTSHVNLRHWSNASRHWERLLEATAGDPRIELVTSRYSGAQMTALVRDADCVVSLHRSEGFGYLVTDAMAFGVPVIATDYSGNADFCDAETSFPVPYRLIAVPPGAARWRCNDAEWADADVEAAAAQMRRVFADYDGALAVAARARRNIVRKYSVEAFRATLAARIAAIRARLT